MEEFTFFWSIENYSQFWRQGGCNMKSPVFVAGVLKDTAWTVSLYPNGRDYVSVFFCRKENDDGPENIRLHFELSLLAADLSTLWSKNGVRDFKMGTELDWVIKMYDVLLQQKTESFAHHILIVRGKVWRVEGSSSWIEQTYARSRIGVEKISFDQEVEVLIKFVANEKRTDKIQSRSKKGLAILSSVHYCSCSFEQIVAEISLSDKSQFIAECKLYVLDASENVIEQTQGDIRFNSETNKILKLPLCLTMKEVMDRKDEYLLYGCLHFLWECTFTTGLEFQKIEETVSHMTSLSMKHVGNSKTLAKHPTCPTPLYKNLREFQLIKFLTDVELKTQSNSFSAHKLMLCASSNYFKDRIGNDMQQNIHCIEMDDLDDNTLQQLLFFLYSDYLEDLQMKNATKLYYAAFKYKFEKLKEICFNFLICNLSPSTTIELLVFADAHSDSELKKVVEDFILKHAGEAFGSDEWTSLWKENPELAWQTMRLNSSKKR